MAAAVLLCAGGGAAQIITLYSSHPAQVGAREAAMGDAAVGDAWDATSMYWNPAGLVYIRNTDVIISHQMLQSISRMNDNVSFPLRTGQSDAVGIGLTVDHTGYAGNTAGLDFRVLQFGYDIAYAREIFPTLALGVGIGVRYAHTSASELWGISSSYGIYYYPSEEVSYGVTLNGVGSGVLFVSDRVTTTLSSENLPRSLQAGVTIRYPEQPDQTYFTLAVANEKVFGADGINYKGGIEYDPWKFLALRLGYNYHADVASFARYGIGFHTSRFGIDYAISPSLSSERQYQFTFNWAFRVTE